MFRNQTIFSALAALFITAFSMQAQAQTLPKECSTALIQYRGNFQINDIHMQLNNAKRYQQGLAAQRTAEDTANLKRITAVIRNLQSKLDALYIVQIDCMYLNPVYSNDMNGIGGGGM